MSLSDLRRDYSGTPLDEAHAEGNPFAQFATWFDEARQTEVDPTAMALSSVGRDGQPTSRMVLLKSIDASGLVFYTNYESRKGLDLADNPRVALLFYWGSLNRQIRIEGRAERVTDADSDAYFASRPADSRLAALVSPQSRMLAARSELEERFAAAATRFPAADMGRPSFWGGYRVVPHGFEFWQGRPNRLHDRLRYDRQADGVWARVRLAP